MESDGDENKDDKNAKHNNMEDKIIEDNNMDDNINDSINNDHVEMIIVYHQTESDAIEYNEAVPNEVTYIFVKSNMVECKLQQHR